MSVFREHELAYLAGQRLGRLATVGADGAPHNVPVGFRYDPGTDSIVIGGHRLDASKKWRDVGRDPRVAFVVDDVLPPWRPRMVEVRGIAERLTKGGSALGPGFDEAMIRVRPARILSFGLDGPRGSLDARDVAGR